MAWWKDGNHNAIVQTVEGRYDGNWGLYESIWTRLRDKLTVLHDEGASVQISADSGALEGRSLRRHIGDIERKVSVIRCLAKAHSEEDPELSFLTQFETAAGPAQEPAYQRGSLTTRGRTTAVPLTTGPLRSTVGNAAPEVKVITRCEGKTTKFRITNLGQSWPGIATFLVARKTDGTVLSERRLRMAGGQTVSFNIQDTSKGHGLLELRIVPSWDPDSPRRAAAKCT